MLTYLYSWEISSTLKILKHNPGKTSSTPPSYSSPNGLSLVFSGHVCFQNTSHSFLASRIFVHAMLGFFSRLFSPTLPPIATTLAKLRFVPPFRSGVVAPLKHFHTMLRFSLETLIVLVKISSKAALHARL